MQALLSTTYFGPVQWYQKLCRYDTVMIERYDSYGKQTYRNRCVIATANGTQALTVPVIRNEELRIKNEELRIKNEESGCPVDACGQPDSSFFILHSSFTKDVRISDHGNWRHLHWHALMSAYSESPFFDYYADDLRPFFERRWEFLYDFNMEICAKMCELLDIRPDVRPTTEYVKTPPPEAVRDFRDVINPKRPLPDSEFEPRRYYQVFGRKHGFQPNLSILDLLFSMGPESIFYLI